MQENNFEREVKKRMEEFMLSPSATAWEKINRKLQEKKRRKAPFIFLLIAGLLAAGIIVLNPFSANRQLQQKTLTSNKASAGEPLPADSIKTQAQQQIVTAQKSSNINDNNAAIHNPNKRSPATLTVEKNLYQFKSKSEFVPGKNFNINKDNKTNVAINNNSTIRTNENLTIRQQVNNLADSIAKTNDNAVSSKNAGNNEPADALNKPLANDSSDTENISALNKSVDSNSNTAVKEELLTKKIKPVKQALPKWQFGVTALYGSNTTAEDLYDADKSYAIANLNAPGLPVRLDSTQSNKIYESSNAYGVGLTAQKRILKNAFISSGLNFVHLSTKSTVGSKINSLNDVPVSYDNQSFSISQYFRPSSSTIYTNSYNFIELPVLFQQDFWPLHKISLSYNAGATIRQLVSSKSLIYNESSNIYFSKKALLSKTQVQLAAALNLKFNAGKTASIYIGPQLSYSLTSLFKNNYSPNFHFINYGLQAGLLLHKK